MRKMLCIEDFQFNGTIPATAPVKKGDIVTWKEDVFIDSSIGKLLFYRFVETEYRSVFHAKHFVELPDMSDEALEKETKEEVYETEIMDAALCNVHP